MMELQQLWKEIYPSDKEEGSKVDKNERSQEDEEEEEEEEEAGNPPVDSMDTGGNQ